MKRLALTLILSFLSVAAYAGEAESIARLRDLYRLMDFQAGAREGRALIAQYPGSTELRAWYIANLASVDTDEAMTLAHRLRLAHPDDAWSLFALASAQVNDTKEFQLAAATSEKMVAAYKGSDPEVFRLRAQILRELNMGDQLEKYLEGKSEPWAAAERANWLDVKSFRDQSLVPEADAALAAVEAADPSDVRVLFNHAGGLWTRRRTGEAVPLLQRAIAASPDSLRIRKLYWQTLGTAKKDVVAADVAAYLAKRPDWPAVIYGAHRAYSDLGMETEKKALGDRLLREFPDTSQAEWVAYDEPSQYARQNMNKRSDPAIRQEMVKRWRTFIDYPFHALGDELFGHGAYQSLFVLLRTEGSDEDFLWAVDGYLATNDQSDVASSVAEVLATRGLRLEQAEKLARIGVRDAMLMLERSASFYTKDEWARTSEMRKGLASLALGWTLLNRNKTEEAGKHLRAAMTALPKDANAYHHLGKWYEATNQLTKADETYAAGMPLERAGLSTNADALRALYVKRHGSDEGWDAYFVAAKEGAASKEKRGVLKSRIVPARRVKTPFALTTLAGDKVSLKSLNGKVTLVKFWGVWCGPCVGEMPAFQKLVDKYSDDPKVAIVTIDTDRDEAIPKKFMAKNNYNFPVLLDDGWVSRSTGVNSYPTAWFIAPDGKVAFEKKGVSADLVSEYSWRIDALK